MSKNNTNNKKSDLIPADCVYVFDESVMQFEDDDCAPLGRDLDGQYRFGVYRRGSLRIYTGSVGPGTFMQTHPRERDRLPVTFQGSIRMRGRPRVKPTAATPAAS